MTAWARRGADAIPTPWVQNARPMKFAEQSIY